MSVEWIEGGLTAAKGYRAAGEHIGVRKNRTKRDVALVVSDVRAAAASCYTQNLVQGAPIAVTKKNLQDGHAQAIICNSGNANTCNANGIEIAEGMCSLVEKFTGVSAMDVVVASTGVIGQPMSLEPFEQGMESLAKALRAETAGGRDAAEAIMTTDTCVKEAAVTFLLGGKHCTLGGASKGSGMICPNMATMLCFLTTDAAVSPQALQQALSTVVGDSFNMLSVDGDTSTNDMVSILANGLAGNSCVQADGGEEYESFMQALFAVCERLCRMMARDGEGAQHLITCKVRDAVDVPTAKAVAKSVIKSSLLKAAVFGADANWGRVLCAIGYSGVALDVSQIDVAFESCAGFLPVCKAGAGIPFDEELAKKVLSQEEVDILVTLSGGKAEATAWGCDLTYDYVKINGDYRT